MLFKTANNFFKSIFSGRLVAAFVLLPVLLLALNVGAQTTSTAPPSTDPAYRALADVLENPQSRERLIEQLRVLGHEPEAASAAGAAARAPVATAEPPLSQRLANGLQKFTESVAHDFSDTLDVVHALVRGQPAPGVTGGMGSTWWPALLSLVVAIAAVITVYLLLRLLAARGFARLNTWLRQEAAPEAVAPAVGLRRYTSMPLSRKLLGVLAALAIDIAVSLAAAVAGYAAVVAISGGQPGASVFAMQFLTAFVMIEVAKALVRGVFSTRYDRLRLLPMSAEAAVYWNGWLEKLIDFTGYGLLVLVPLANALFLPSVGKLLGLLIMSGIYVYAVRVVWKNRRRVRDALIERADDASAAVFGTLIRVLARTWHLIALAYFTVLLVVSQTDQQQALSFMALATGQSLAAIAVGMLLAAALSSLLARRIAIPEEWRKALPLLEVRINAYVPALLKGLRLLILFVVALVVLDAWRAFDLAAWMESDRGHAAIAMLFHVGIILVIAAFTWTVIASLIEHRLGAASGHGRPSEREKTLLMLFRNAAAIVIATMTVLVLLSQIGIDIGPLIAGAGVAGLAIGFGAQKLVQDVITGVFIQLENGMNQNDTVELSGLFGTVEKITIRSVVVRTLDGGYHLIPFSSIDKLTNHTRDYGCHYAEYTISHRENVDDAIAQLEQAFQELMQDPELAPEVLEDISIPGVTSLNERGFNIRVLIKTTPGNQWAVQRGFNRLVKKHFDAAGIEHPYPQTVLHFGRDKEGHTPAMDVRFVDSLKKVSQEAQDALPAAPPAMRPEFGSRRS